MKIEPAKSNSDFPRRARVKPAAAFLFTICAVIFFINCARQNPIDAPVTISSQPDSIAPILAKKSAKTADYKVFSHTIKDHAEIKCSACHERTDNRAAPQFAGHNSCIECHLEQFVTENSQMCAICHSSVNAAPAPLKSFPANFNEPFKMKFDHQIHNRGAARPAQGCAACHQPLNAAALSIPANLSAHNNCFACHTPELTANGRNLGECNVCHSIGNYVRASTGGAAFKTSFTHQNHNGVNCAGCHTIRADAAQPQQVSAPVVGMHRGMGSQMNCTSCHNDRDAFGDRDFANCRRCHLGQNFAQIPNGR